MSAFSERVRSRKSSFFKVGDFEGGKEIILTIKYLDEEVAMFDKTIDILSFIETAQQLSVNQTVAEWLLDNLGDDPEKWAGQQVSLYLGTYEYNKETKQGIRLKLPGTPGDAQTRTRPAADPKPDIDDAIPF